MPYLKTYFVTKRKGRRKDRLINYDPVECVPQYGRGQGAP